MRISRLRTTLLGREDPGTPSGATGQLILLEVEASAGITGLGAVHGAPELAREIEQRIGAQLEGADLTLVQGVIERLNASATPAAQRCLELALWDVVGKAAGEPVYRLWGGHKDRVLCLGTIEGRAAATEHAASARRLVADGFRGVVLRPGAGELEQLLEPVSAIRDAVGEQIMIAVDCGSLAVQDGGSWERFVDGLEQLDVGWLEVSLRDQDPGRLPRLPTVPLVAGAELQTIESAAGLIGAGSCDILRAGAAMTMLTRWKAAALAEAAGLSFLPTAAPDGMSLLANLHLAAAAPSCRWFEVPTAGMAPLSTRLLPDADGFLALPDAPGFGFELDSPTIEAMAA